MFMRYLGEFGTWIVGGIGAMYSFATGYIDQGIQILLWVMVIDVVSGLMKGYQQHRLKSAIMGMGIIKKGAILLSIVFASLLDMFLNDGQAVFRTMMIWIAVGNESLSIVENLTAMGVSIPSAITERLAQVTQEAKDLQNEKDSNKKTSD
ncbi:phage holin family protein [Bacillus wiedmannii]|uniref:phage holin family protein n=1 Tax=Bacillus wiedmannii TaxID=1890302 RepID=UPI0020D26AAA|nr:phage holin family protein [Bacillus wiedmannii]